jgi:sulfate adenylyltransferase
VSGPRLVLNQRQYLELEKLALGALAPLTGFMNEHEFAAVVTDLHLPGGALFPLPVVLDLSEEASRGVRVGQTVTLTFEGAEVGTITIESLFSCDKDAVAKHVFGTVDRAHPGVAHFLRMGHVFAGGPVRLTRRAAFAFSSYELTPAETRARFAEAGWQTVVGFQTRNVPHRAHEYLLRLALEQADGLFVQPLVGARKRGDYTPEAILTGYRALIDGFLPRERVLFGVLSTSMRYAGPREALFHAIIRRNYGCTHFIVGRDHAGVGSYYGKYEAHEMTRRYEAELGIRILRFAGPFYCARCDGIVTERHCPHGEGATDATLQISGTNVRASLVQGNGTAPHVMRPDVLASLRGMPIFIEEDSE